MPHSALRLVAALWRQLKLLPLDAQAYLLTVVLVVGVPPGLLVISELDPDGRDGLARVGQYRLLLLVAATLVFERPAGAAPRVYFAQLRHRFLALQQHHQAALARQFKEKNR